MTQYIFKLPDIGEGIAAAEIVSWHVQVGDFVAEDAPLADMMTDKATVEIESPVSGRIVALSGAVGDQISIGAMLVELAIEGASIASTATPDDAQSDPTAAPPTPVVNTVGAPESALSSHTDATPEPAVSNAGEPDTPPSVRLLSASPAVRGRARNLGIDLRQVKSAQDARIRHSDLDAFITYHRGYQPGVATRQDEIVKVMGLRRRIAENMAASKRHIPHFSYVEEVDVTRLENMRFGLNAAQADRPKLTILPFLIVAICKAIPDFPMINARYDDEAGIVTRHGAVHMGIATQTDAGLMVPVVRDAHTRNIWQLARDVAEQAEAARSGKAKSENLSGSTLTITSLGALGGMATTPVINRPEVAILGPNKIFERPAYVSDASGHERIEKRKFMNISMSCDHRVVDGWDAAQFLQTVKKRLEEPALILT